MGDSCFVCLMNDMAGYKIEPCMNYPGLRPTKDKWSLYILQIVDFVGD